MEMNIRLDREGNLYEQIYTYIREEIRQGNLARGERLPSTRALASYLHLSRTTVQLAYDQLLSEGYIEARQGSGSYVCGIENMSDLSGITDPAPGIQQAENAAASVPAYNSVTDSAAENVIDFSPRDIDMSQFPYPTWRRIMRDLMTGDRSDVFTRGDAQGDLALRETIAHYLHLSRGCRCSADQIIVGAGTDYLLLLLSFILGRNRTIAVENPGYVRAYKILQAAGYRVVTTAMDQYGCCVPNAIQTPAPDLLYIMPARQYPTGISMPYTRRAELLRWAESAPDRYLIEDDYDSLFRYQGKPAPSLQSDDRHGRVIYMGTFSKSIAPAIRVSYMILPTMLLPRYHENAAMFASTVPRIDQAILNEFIRGGYYERYLNRMRNRYRAKHDTLLTALQPLTQTNHYTITGAGSGLHLILTAQDYTASSLEDLRAEEERITTLLRDVGVLIHPITHLLLPNESLSAGYTMHPTWLLGYASLTPDEIVQGAQILLNTLP